MDIKKCIKQHNVLYTLLNKEQYVFREFKNDAVEIYKSYLDKESHDYAQIIVKDKGEMNKIFMSLNYNDVDYLIYLSKKSIKLQGCIKSSVKGKSLFLTFVNLEGFQEFMTSIFQEFLEDHELRCQEGLQIF